MQTSILVKQKDQCRKQNHDEEAVTTVGNFELVDSKEVPVEALVNYDISVFPLCVVCSFSILHNACSHKYNVNCFYFFVKVSSTLKYFGVNLLHML